MTISKNALDVLKNIVGEEFYSDEPCILDTYAFNWLAEMHPKFTPSKFGYRPPAVIMPGNTEEVQAIVKACNRYKVKFKAHSTGYGIQAFPGVEDVVVVDLRRMNQILEIDEKNKIAVVEPYVNWAELGCEVMKHGLYTTPIQAGSQASVLANVTSVWGVNTFGNHGGHNGRNMLGVEWITPSGELLKLGCTDGWYSADGPGPSMRGVIRGHLGHCGSMGIMTKCSLKLHNWPGPPELRTKTDPDSIIKYELDTEKTPVEFVKAYMVCFPEWENLVEFCYKVGDAEIAYMINRIGGIEHLICLLPDANLIKNLYDTGMVSQAAEMMPYPLNPMVWANSKREFDYNTSVMDKIIEETGGFVPQMMEMMGIDVEAMTVHMMIANDTHFVHHSGGFVINGAYTCTPDAMYKHQGPGGESLKQKYIDRGVIMDDGLDGLYTNSFENNAFAYGEVEYHYDASNIDMVKGAIELIAEEDELVHEKGSTIETCNAMVGLGMGIDFNDRMERLGEKSGNFHKWQKKIKTAFDPNDVTDPSGYIVHRNNLIKVNEDE